jgi:hypothetical protein
MLISIAGYMTLKIDKIGMANNIKSSRLGSIFYR